MRRSLAASLCIIAAVLVAAHIAAGPAAGQRVATSFTVENDPIVNLAWSPDGTKLAYCGWPGCRILDAGTGKITATIPDTASVIAGAGQGVIGFTADSKTLILPALAGRQDELVSLWDTTTGAAAGDVKLPAEETAGTTAAIFSLAANAKMFAALTNGVAQPLLLYSLPDRRLVRAVPPRAPDATMTIALSPDGAVLATSLGHDSIIAYASATGQEIGRVTYQLDWQVAPINSLAYSPDGRFLAAGFGNGGKVQVPGPGDTMVTLPSPWPMEPIYLWHVKNGAPFGAPMKLCGPQPQGAPNMVWTPDSRAVIFADGYGAAKLCPVTGTPASTLWRQNADAVAVPAVSPDGGRLAIGAAARIDIVALPKTPPGQN